MSNVIPFRIAQHERWLIARFRDDGHGGSKTDPREAQAAFDREARRP